ncbi:hypothetical protein [Streptosporangium lutulentum]|uniref:Protein phosphatase 2C n=1 Tax=Streptosporangium lutulentum TaxID=1461250 RepID=A0ABT9QLU5_9ACTN|nr:hypothetical protein [Streptosporangium lutulentum]MDP9847725.1 hypothetical protein [Streptosporangium lutulentum]
MRLTLATEPAYPDRPNEDFIGATPDAVVLLDGAGTPADLESGCSHGIAWYSHTLGSTLLAAVTQSADPLTTILAAGIKATASMHDFCCDLSHPGSPSATVVMLRRSADTLDWLVLADSVLVLDLLDADPMVICDQRQALTDNRHRGPTNTTTGGSPEHLQALSHYMETTRTHRNVNGEFWVASVDPLAADQALTGTVPTDRVRATAILSDGASRLVDRFGLATWRQALDLLNDSGPEELTRHPRSLFATLALLQPEFPPSSPPATSIAAFNLGNTTAAWLGRPNCHSTPAESGSAGQEHYPGQHTADERYPGDGSRRRQHETGGAEQGENPTGYGDAPVLPDRRQRDEVHTDHERHPGHVGLLRTSQGGEHPDSAEEQDRLGDDDNQVATAEHVPLRTRGGLLLPGCGEPHGDNTRRP